MILRVALLLCCLFACTVAAFQPHEVLESSSSEDNLLLNITFVYNGPVGDFGYNYAFDLARNALQVHYSYNVWCYYIITDATNYAQSVEDISNVAKDSNLVITSSSDFRDQTVAVAAMFPDVKFLMAGGTSNLSNIGIYQTVYNDARYLTGMVAAMSSKTNITCFLSAYRLNFLVQSFNAYYYGALSINPYMKAIIAFTDTWSDVDAEDAAVKKMMDMGCDVVNGQTNNIQWQKTVASNNKTSLGFNSDIRLLVGESVLTSIINDFTDMFIMYIDALLDGNFISGVYFFNMANKGVQMADFSQEVTRNEARRVYTRNLTDPFFCGPIYSAKQCNISSCWDSKSLIFPPGQCISNWDLTNYPPFLMEGVIDLGTIYAPGNNGQSSNSSNIIVAGLRADSIVGIAVGGAAALLLVSAFTIWKVRQHRAAAVLVLKQVEEGQKKNYKIIYSELKFHEKIGSGNFGMVYSGEYRGADVAIKKLKQQDLQKPQIDEFTQEVSVMVGLRHPNIVLLMGACAEPSNLCIVTEFMPQGSLYSVLHNERVHFSGATAKAMIVDMLKGLQFIHSAGLLHRDLKSPNLLVDKRGNLKLADFGLTILQSASTKMVHVSVPWTAPEIFAGRPFTAKSDVYSVGIILWEILTRNVPYGEMLPPAIPMAVIQGKRPQLPQPNHPGLVLPGLIPIIQRCWANSPLDRPDVTELRHSVEILELGDSTSRGKRRDRLIDSGIGFGLSEAESWESSTKTDESLSSTSTISIVLPKMAAPTGAVTIVFLDVPESTNLWEWDAPTMQKSLTLLHLTVELLLFKHRGYMSKNDGDAYILSFGETTDGVAFAVDMHLELLKQDWPAKLLSHPEAQEENANGLIWKGLRVRVAVHAGPVHSAIGPQAEHVEYSGHVVDLAVKLGRMGQPGQSLMTDYMRKLIGNTGNRLINQAAIVDLQSRPLKVFQITHHSLLNRTFLPTIIDLDDSAPELDSKDLLSKPEKWIIPIKDLRIGEKIGIGQFGESFMCTYGDDNVVLKVFPVRGLKSSVKLELRMEMVKLITLAHPNVIKMYGMVMQAEIGVVQEFVSRGPLTTVLMGRDEISWERKLAFALGMASGLAYLHENDILHWDIKPSNFLVTSDWEVKVADLGFARIKTQYQTTTQSAVVAWTAPEVFDGESYSKEAEVYAFGIILWEIITRQQAWEGIHAVKIADMVTQGLRPSVANIATPNPIAVGLVKTCIQCWGPVREERPSFAVIAETLRQLAT